ncbi:MAG: transcriptional regulator, MarR family [candidate division NC10 bacterium]|jgi:DNA-binding MarR family transcriptional regulator|nr:transcriptional regulator, MarR family [candidate division NC10 bacterium]
MSNAPGRLPQVTTSATPCVCAAFRKAARALTLLYDAYLRPSGLRVTQYSLLKNVLARQPVGVNKLADATVTDRTTLTRNLRILQRRGLIEIREGEDRRAREVTVTPRGRDTVAKATPAWKRAQAYVIGQVGTAHWRILREELDMMVALGRRR